MRVGQAAGESERSERTVRAHADGEALAVAAELAERAAGGGDVAEAARASAHVARRVALAHAAPEEALRACHASARAALGVLYTRAPSPSPVQCPLAAARDARYCTR